jgi:hypothetical protein
MALTKRKQDFFETAEGVELKNRLEMMQSSDKYNTQPSYSPKSDLYEDNLIPFMDKHINYLNSHPLLDPIHYISNLELVTRIR